MQRPRQKASSNSSSCGLSQSWGITADGSYLAANVQAPYVLFSGRCSRRLAQTPDVWSLRFRRNLFPFNTGMTILLSVPSYYQVYPPGDFQFITGWRRDSVQSLRTVGHP